MIELPENFGFGGSHLNTLLRPVLIELQEAAGAAGGTFDADDIDMPVEHLGYVGDTTAVPVDWGFAYLYTSGMLNLFDATKAHAEIAVVSAGGEDHYLQTGDTIEIGGIQVTLVAGAPDVAGDAYNDPNIGNVTANIIAAFQDHPDFESAGFTLQSGGSNVIMVDAQTPGAAGNGLYFYWVSATPNAFTSLEYDTGEEEGQLHGGYDRKIDPYRIPFSPDNFSEPVYSVGAALDDLDRRLLEVGEGAQASISVVPVIREDFMSVADLGEGAYVGAVPYMATGDGSVTAGEVTSIRDKEEVNSSSGSYAGVTALPTKSQRLATTNHCLWAATGEGAVEFVMRAQFSGSEGLGYLGLVDSDDAEFDPGEDVGIWFKRNQEGGNLSLHVVGGTGGPTEIGLNDNSDWFWFRAVYNSAAGELDLFTSPDGVEWTSIHSGGYTFPGQMWLVLFADNSGGSFAGSNVFLDYWHLTSDGGRDGTPLTLAS